MDEVTEESRSIINEGCICGVCKKIPLHPVSCTSTGGIFCKECCRGRISMGGTGSLLRSTAEMTAPLPESPLHGLPLSPTGDGGVLTDTLTPYNTDRGENPLCPTCLEPHPLTPLPRMALSFLRMLKVYCYNQENGCEEQVEYARVEAHMEECAYARVDCEYCGSLGLKKDSKSHRKDCQFRRVSCAQCGLLMLTKEVETHSCIKYLAKGIHHISTVELRNINHLPEYITTLQRENYDLKEKLESVEKTMGKKISHMEKQFTELLSGMELKVNMKLELKVEEIVNFLGRSKICSSCLGRGDVDGMAKCSLCPHTICPNCHANECCPTCKTAYCLACLHRVFKKCTTCQLEICPTCLSACGVCGGQCCGKCLGSCPWCERTSCASCMRKCIRCTEHRCKGCMSDCACVLCKICMQDYDKPKKCIYCENKSACKVCRVCPCPMGQLYKSHTKFKFRAVDLTSHGTSHALKPNALLTYPKNGLQNFGFDNGRHGHITFDTKEGGIFVVVRLRSRNDAKDMQFAVEYSDDNYYYHLVAIMKCGENPWDEIKWKNKNFHRYWRFRVISSNGQTPYYHTIEWFSRKTKTII